MQTSPRQKFALTCGMVILILAASFIAPATEARAQSSVFIVNTTDDLISGSCDATHCSLREAILAANANPNGAIDSIYFNISSGCSAGVCTITPLSALPTITQAVLIDGYTQPGASPNTLACGTNAVLRIELNGASAGTSAHGLTIISNGSTIRGLVINRFAGDGVNFPDVRALSNRVQGNFIGVNTGGAVVLPNNGNGITINNAPSNLIGGTTNADRNLISGNAYGIRVTGASASGSTIQGNIIGLNANGMVRLYNNSSGVMIENVPNITIGGSAASAGNVISGNQVSGVQILGGASSNNKVQGNFIGTNCNGTAAISNGWQGVSINGAPNNTIGGTAAGARNIISGNNSTGILIQNPGASGNFIQGNYIGTDVTGAIPIGNGDSGIILEGSVSTTVGGTLPAARNVISGNTYYGVSIELGKPGNNMVQGNYIGTNAAGTADLGNTYAGVQIDNSSQNTIGGTASGAGNLISGNDMNGIQIQHAGVPGNTIQGNLIGTNASGTASLGNGNGIETTNSPGNTIGGAVSGARNIISGNIHHGVYIVGTTLGSGAAGQTVQGNYIGTNSSGTGAVGNGEYGVYILDAPNNLIGGTAPLAGNIISGNAGSGVDISNTATNNLVQGNIIGAGADGLLAVPNGANGVLVNGPQNTIGGTDSGAGNIITGNGANGVVITSTTSPGNPIQGNAIFSNGALGIDLGDNGVTANDLGDGDSTNDGANRLQNFPLLTSLSTSGLGGTLNSTASTAFRVELFASAACDPSGYGEGEQFVGAQNVSTNGSGNASFTFSFTPSPSKPYFTATATNTATGDTSEFSPCLSFAPTVTLAAQPASSTYGGSVTLTATVTTSDPAHPYPPGQVQFKDGAANLGAPVTLNASGQAQVSTSTLTAGSHTLVAQYLGGASYPSAEDTLPYTVSKKALTVTGISAANKVYDGTTAAALNTGSAALAGVVSGDTVTLVTSGATGAFANKNAAAGKPVTVSGLSISGADAANYTLTQPVLTANIEKRVLTVTAQNKSKVYGEAIPVLTVIYANFAPGDSPSVLTSPPALTTTATAASPVGSYPITITPGSPAAQNYTFTLVAGTLTVGKASTGLVLIAPTTTPPFGQPITLTATVTVLVPGAGTPGGTVTFSEGATVLGTAALSPNGSDAAAAVLTIPSLSEGVHILKASYGGSPNFNIVSGTLRITVGQGKKVYLPMLSKTQ